MSYTKANYTDVEDKHGLHFMRDALDAEKQGFTVLETEEGFEGMEHDHADEEQEEIYFLVSGEAEVDIEGETVEMEEGDAVRISAEDSRTLRTPEASKLVLVGAP
ncbi:MAG: cupin domain-containing protein [Candidatus Nanosalina sp.]